MNTPILTFVFDRRKRATKDKEAAIEIRITFNRKQKYMTTGVRLLPKHWKNGHVTGRMDAAEIQRTLDLYMVRVRSVVNGMVERGKVILDEIPSAMGQMMGCQRSFIDYCKERSEVRKYGKTKDSQERYNRFMRFLIMWGKMVYFNDVNEKNVLAMDEALKQKGLRNYSKWNNYHRFLNSFIIDAMADGLIRKNPYRHIHIEKDKSSGGIGKYLTPDEFRRIEKVRLQTECLQRVRDLFVFQTYTCLSYADLATFDVSKAINVGGRKVYIGNRGKTKQEFSFLLLKPAEVILKKYGGKLPMLSNAKYNDYLKVLALSAKIDKPISSHWARHTGATLLLNSGVNMEVVAKVLGHSSTKVTRTVYAKLLDETVVDAMSVYEGQLKRVKESKPKASENAD